MKEYDSCEFCGGPVIEERVTEAKRWNGRWVIVEDIPVGVCKRCGQRYYEGPVLEDVERLVKDDATTLYTITVPVKKYRPMPIPEDTEVLDALRALDNCAGAERERQATKLLQRFEEKRVVEAISQALRKDEKSWREFKDVLQEVLSQVRETMALEELTFCLYDPSPLMVEVAIEALTETGDLRAIEHLSELSEDEELEASLRLKAAEALARLKGVVV